MSRRRPRHQQPCLTGIDFTDVEILRALAFGKTSLREIGDHLGCCGECGAGGKVSPQFVRFRLLGLVERKWVSVERMPGKGNGARRLRTLTRGGRMALKRFG